MKLSNLKPKIPQMGNRLPLLTLDSHRTTHRIRGRELQETRLRLWTANPRCAMCNKLVQYPGGFDLDHKIPIEHGGSNDDSNLQILCNGDGACHDIKTKAEGGKRIDYLKGK
jgi:5-methylcytosine-specific restriction endonuclease McrA